MSNKIKQCKAMQQISIDRMSDLAEIATAAKTSPDLHAQFKARFTHLEDIYQEFENQNATLVPLLIAADTYNNDEFKTLSRNFYQYYYHSKSTYSSLFDADHDPNSSSIQVTSQVVPLQIRPCNSPKPIINFSAIVMPKVCNYMPSHDIDARSWSHLSNLKLADPCFYLSSDIDLLLGADIFPLIFEDSQLPRNENEPSAFHTVFGWILMGTVSCEPSSNSLNSLHCSCDPPLDTSFKRFCEVEEVPRICKSTPEDNLCEQIFTSTVSRTTSAFRLFPMVGGSLLAPRTPSKWPSSFNQLNDDRDCFTEEKKVVLSMQADVHFLDALLERFSSFVKMQRIVAYMRRFIANCHVTSSQRIIYNN
ncbi:hypothetical protein JTB14_004209 [Gonioctena quinquepunctata]|nr:hypothetical protein JTB14_004209 [Gonioctena quinquepunctata]